MPHVTCGPNKLYNLFCLRVDLESQVKVANSLSHVNVFGSDKLYNLFCLRVDLESQVKVANSLSHVNVFLLQVEYRCDQCSHHVWIV